MDLAVSLVDSLLLVVVKLHINLDFQLLFCILFGLSKLLSLENSSLSDF